MKIGIFAPSSVIPKVELALGVRTIEQMGFETKVHSQTYLSQMGLAGTESQRAKAFIHLIEDPKIDVIWCARGGYGATYLPEILDRHFKKRKVPKKLLIGFSDVTALHEYVRNRWGWPTLHAPMVAWRYFSKLSRSQKTILSQLVCNDFSVELGFSKLKFYGSARFQPIQAGLVGGNLAVLCSTLGTNYEMDARRKMLFLEEIDENPFRVERMLRQLEQAGKLDQVKALVLGQFIQGDDRVRMVLKKQPKNLEKPKSSELKPLRRKLSTQSQYRDLFERFSKRTGIPVAYGLEVGHGRKNQVLPFGGKYELNRKGQFTLRSWTWE